MADFNCCTFTGRLGADPEMRYTPNGQAVCNFSIACGESWKDKDGNKKERTEWVRVVTFGKLAEIAGQYLTKGKQVLISGKMQTRSWDDKDGNKKYTTEIIASTMQMLGSKDSGKAEEQEPEGQAIPPDDIDGVPF